MALKTIEVDGVEADSAGGLKTVLSNTGIDRRSFARIPTVWEMPDLVQVQIESFEWFKREGLRELLEEISPIWLTIQCPGEGAHETGIQRSPSISHPATVVV